MKQHTWSDIKARTAPDVRARIEAEAQEMGKSEFILRTEVTDEAGVVVASTEGVYQVRKMM